MDEIIETMIVETEGVIGNCLAQRDRRLTETIRECVQVLEDLVRIKRAIEELRGEPK